MKEQVGSGKAMKLVDRHELLQTVSYDVELILVDTVNCKTAI